MTEGFGRQWKDFFYGLETHHGLDVEDPSHIWLLHWLFLPAINEDATAWASTWNSHKIQLEGERRSSPQQLYLKSYLNNGIKGLPANLRQPEGNTGGDGEPEDYSTYGIDWEAMNSSHLMYHHHTNNLEEEAGSPFHQHPAWINEVVCKPPNCPLTEDQVERFEEELAGSTNLGSNNMGVCKLVWVTALELCRKLHTKQEERLVNSEWCIVILE